MTVAEHIPSEIQYSFVFRETMSAYMNDTVTL